MSLKFKRFIFALIFQVLFVLCDTYLIYKLEGQNNFGNKFICILFSLCVFGIVYSISPLFFKENNNE